MYKRKTKLSPIHISLIALAILVVIAVIVTFAVKKDEPKEPAAQSGIVYDDSAIEGGWETALAGGNRAAPQRQGAGGHDQHQLQHRAVF
ncbi:MAG: hypothetical protein ACLU3I_15040 [Acutalibacteraceae bacterium]